MNYNFDGPNEPNESDDDFDQQYKMMFDIHEKFNNEYNQYVNIIGLKNIVEQFTKYDLFNELEIKYFNDLFENKKVNIFNIDTDVDTDVDVDVFSKITKKILLKYLHPDKILSFYGEEINIKYADYFSNVTGKINSMVSKASKASIISKKILSEIHGDNIEIFDLLIAKLLENDVLIADDIEKIKESIKKSANNIDPINIPININARTNTNNKTNYDSDNFNPYSVFSPKVIIFVDMYNRINRTKPVSKFSNDVYRIVNSMYWKLKKIIIDDDIVKKLKKNNITFLPNSETEETEEIELPNIIQLLKMDNNEFAGCMDIFKTHFPNCYVKMIQIMNPIKISEICFIINNPIFIRIDDFANEIKNDYMIGAKRMQLNKYKNMLSQIDPILIEKIKQTDISIYNESTIPEELKIVKEILQCIKIIENTIKTLSPENIDKYECIDMYLKK